MQTFFIASAVLLTLCSIDQGAFAAGTGEGFGPEARTACTAFVGVTAVPMDQEGLVPDATVVIRGDRIVAVGASRHTSVPTDCDRIDGKGRYLMPGMIDSHVHFFGYKKPKQLEHQYLDRIDRMLLANGITTALVMEGTPELLAQRDAISRGEIDGPRLYVAGALIQMDRGGLPPGRAIFPTVSDVEAEVRSEAAAGYDFIKVHGDMTPEGYRALLKTAAATRMSVIGHAPPNLGIDVALTSGQILIAHAESYLDAYFRWNRPLPVDAAEIDKMVRDISTRTARSGVWVQPTLSVFRQIIDQVGDPEAIAARPAMAYMPVEGLVGWLPEDNPYLKNWTAADLSKLRAQYRLMQSLTRGLYKAHVPLLAGTDDMVPVQLPGFSMRDELEQLVSAGLTPFSALEAATTNPARFLHLDGKGTITVGATADLVLLAANPLDDVDNAFLQDGVMVRGRWRTKEELMAALTAAKVPTASTPPR